MAYAYAVGLLRITESTCFAKAEMVAINVVLSELIQILSQLIN